MPEVCLNYWQPYGCEGTVEFLWHRTNWITRIDLLVLALMLAYTLIVATRTSYRRYSFRRRGTNDEAGQIELTADLTVKAGVLKSIASAAPYLGLFGACVAILSALIVSINMERSTFELWMSARIASALVTTAAGMLVFVSATCAHNYLRTHIESLQDAIPGSLLRGTGRSFQIAQTFPLAKRFLAIPYATIAAPVLAALVIIYSPFFAPREPTGLVIDLASNGCEANDDERLIVLHITNSGEVFLNTNQENRDKLADRLAAIYRSRVHRTLYFFADAGVSFQTVADIIDIVENASISPQTDELNIRLRWITPSAMNARCVEPHRVRRGPR